MIRFVLESRESLENELRAAGHSSEAIAEGRVFIGRKRLTALDDAAAVDGALVTVWPREELKDAVILREERDWVAVDKPVGIPTIADHAGREHSLAEVTKRAIGASSDLHPTSRLDREVSGVVLFAKTDDGRRLLASLREEGHYRRRYLGIGSSSAALADEGTFREAIGRSEKPRERRVEGKDAVAAETHYRVIARIPVLGAKNGGGASALLFAFQPITGRTHQIRLHASHAGAPLLGDSTYGGMKTITSSVGRVASISRVALHAARVQLQMEKVTIEIVAAVPKSFGDLWEMVGGDLNALEAAKKLPFASQG